MENKILKEIIIVSIFMLVISSSCASAKTINKNSESSQNIECFDGEICIGTMKIDADKDDYEKIKIETEDDFLETNIPDYETKLELNFYANYEIKNEDGDNKDKWVFKIVLKDGLGPYSEVIDSQTKEIDDEFASNDDQNGKIEVSTEIDRASYIGKEQHKRNFRVELVAEYYKGSWLPWETGFEKIAEDDDWGNLETELINQRPLRPTINGPSEGAINTPQTFTAKVSDPEGDQIKYVFIWGDGKSTGTEFVNSGEEAKVSYTWTREGDYKVEVFAYDCFWDAGEAATLRHSAPRSHSTEKSIFFIFLEKYPQLEQILNYFDF